MKNSKQFVSLLLSSLCFSAIADDDVQLRLLSPSLNYQQQETGDTKCFGWTANLGVPCAPYRQREWFIARGLGLMIERNNKSDRSEEFAFGRLLNDNYDRIGAMVGLGKLWNIGDTGYWRIRGGVSAGVWARSVQVGETLSSNYHCEEVDGVRWCHQGEHGSESQIPLLEWKVVTFLAPTLTIKSDNSNFGAVITFFPKPLDDARGPTLMLELTQKF